MNKNNEDILKMIQAAVVKEELAIPVYTTHIKNIFFWSNLSARKQKKIIESLKILETDSEKHSVMLRRVEDIYINSQKNAQ